MFWLLGGIFIGIGLYSGLDKFQTTGIIKLQTYYDILLNISIVLCLMGGIVFIVSFCGCLGALRENTCLLKFYSLCLLIFFLCEMAIAVVGFIFPHTVNTVSFKIQINKLLMRYIFFQILEESFTDRVRLNIFI